MLRLSPAANDEPVDNTLAQELWQNFGILTVNS